MENEIYDGIPSTRGRFTIVERSADTLQVTRRFPNLEFDRVSKATEFIRFCQRTGVAKEGNRYFIKSTGGRNAEQG